MARCQSLAVLVKSQTGEQAGMLCIRSRCPIDSVLAEHSLDLFPQGIVDDRLMLSGIGILFVRDLAAIDAVLKHQIEGTSGEPLTANLGAIGIDSLLAPDSLVIELRP
jgi:hypothetical protein